MTTVALDGRGADRGAEAIVAGARVAAADGIRVRAFGRADELAELNDVDGAELIATDEAITNDEEPVGAVRSKERASVVLAARDVVEGRSDALASAGPTGATMTAALFALKRVHGVRRPALAVQILVPGREAPTILLDAGANAEVRAADLVQFAYLGAAFAEAVLAIERPRVALLSVGEEATKGTQDLIEAHAELAPAGAIDFRGNVEGRDLLAGVVDVVVTDGFTGNVALKTLEGTARAVADAVRAAARSGPLAAAGGLMLRPALGGLRRQMDPNAVGGAILLGLRGIAVVAHGSSTPEGIANAIRLADRAIRKDAVGRTGERLRTSGATREAMREAPAPAGEG